MSDYICLIKTNIIRQDDGQFAEVCSEPLNHLRFKLCSGTGNSEDRDYLSYRKTPNLHILYFIAHYFCVQQIRKKHMPVSSYM